MKWSKILAAGIVTSAIHYVILSGFAYLFRGMYDPTTGLWRAMFTPLWTQYVLLASIILSFLAVFVYAGVHPGLGKKAELAKKGLKYGFFVWMLRDIPISVLAYVFMPLSAAIVSTWLLSGILISLINGIIVSYFYR